MSRESGAAAAEILLTLSEPPSAIFASNDDMAAGVLAVAHRKDIAVPEALSVAGFDDTELASAVWPPLTTIRQPTRDLAYTAAGLLFGKDNGVVHRRLQHELIVREVRPGPNAQSDEALLEHIAKLGATSYHPIGTCKMGSDPMAVVDRELRVRGVRGLRVADASIMPTMVSSNTNAPSFMIGERCADFLLRDAGQNIEPGAAVG